MTRSTTGRRQKDDDLDVAGRRVLMRLDLNVPMDVSSVSDDGKIRACLPTLRALIDRGAAVLACSHLGRSAGAPDPRFTLAPVASRPRDGRRGLFRPRAMRGGKRGQTAK